jgi:hypothetical protein
MRASGLEFSLTFGLMPGASHLTVHLIQGRAPRMYLESCKKFDPFRGMYFSY